VEKLKVMHERFRQNWSSPNNKLPHQNTSLP
jgi:hypothetical protein